MSTMSLRRRGLTTSVAASSMAVLLVGLFVCPLMFADVGQASAPCAETDGSHEPMSDRMSCCSSPTEVPGLTPGDSYSSRVLKSMAVALLSAGPTLAQPRPVVLRHVTSSPIRAGDLPLFLQNGSFLI